MKRCYHIVAIPIRIVLNRFGDHIPHGQMYVLKENEQKVREQVAANPFTPVDLVEPLVIRANEGDLVEILFENQLPHPASIHFQRGEYDVNVSDGAAVGFNPDTTVEPGGQIVYQLSQIPRGILYFSDLANPLASDVGSNPNGLFGALIIQARGSWWTCPVTGDPLNSGLFADVHNPFLPSFREFAWIFHDEPEALDITNNPRLNPMTLQESESAHLVNYRSEPLENRLRLIEEGVVCPECEGEEVHHDSWVFGDPATPILRGYRGDPARIRLIHGGVKETHTFHYHTHTWLSHPRDIDSEIIDVQAISPQNNYTVEVLYGLGSLQQCIGDTIIHCHLYPHFEVGMWGIQRTFDTLQDGSQCYPDGTQICALQPLPGRPVPPKPTPERPGFPNFIPGKVGFKAPRPPLGIIGGREMTRLEEAAAIPRARPGAVFTEVTLGNPEVIEFDISAIQLPILYNKYGWNDPEGRIYVLDKDIDDVLAGRRPIEPLTIYAPAGTVVRINFTNRLPNVLGGNAFQLVARTYEIGLHVHFVKFDVLVADGANVGWNYDSTVLPGETIRYEWFLDVELKATLYHDHQFANQHQPHGVFGSIIVEPRFSKFFDSCTGEPTERGTQVTVTNPLIPDYRDYMLFVHDFAFLFDKDGCPLNPPPYPGSSEDPGVFGVNLRNEPLKFRALPDPAYSFSSYVHGDPSTTILRAYRGDPIRLRLIQGAHEESHSFNLHGLRWKRERRDIDSKLVSQIHIGMTESFTAETFLPYSGDYLWAFETVEDAWLGCWGLLRAYDHKVDDLIKLSDQKWLPECDTPLPEQTCELPPQAVLPEKDEYVPVSGRLLCYHVVAFQMPILYSKYGEHDPYGIVFALAEDVDDILAGSKPVEPLVIRGNVDDIVEVTLENRLKPDHFHNHDGVHEYPLVKLPAYYPPSCKISLHPQLLTYDVKTSSGDTVGFNPDQTIAPGETITYRWYVDAVVGACNMWDMADLRNHRHHGSFGAFIAEGKGSEYLCPYTLQPIRSGANAIITNPLAPDFREFVLMLHDGVRLLDKAGNLIIDPTYVLDDAPDVNLQPDEPGDIPSIAAGGLEEVDTYDQGSRGINYRTERLQNRLSQKLDLAHAFSSEVFGDPSTPIWEAYVGEAVTIRILHPAERNRAHSLHIHGHAWRFDKDDVNSPFVSIEGEMIAGHKQDAFLRYGAGGLNGAPGDYMYRAGNIRWDIELGVWGIMRVHEHPQEHLPPLTAVWKREEDESC